jgi:hypothetical protein
MYYPTMKPLCLKNAIRCFILLLACSLAPTSCTTYRGYGVLVWKNENLPFPVGELVNITSIFSVDNYYEVEYKKTLVQVPMWQLEFFEKYDDAKRYQDDFKPYINLYAFTLKPEGLPIRNAAQPSGSLVGKLAVAQLAKVIGRDKEVTKIDKYESYWYAILTENGTRGYVFGHFLKTVESAANLDEKVQELIKADPALERFLKNIWYPAKTAEMLGSGNIDSEYLNKNYALTPKPELNKVILSNEDFPTKEFVYSTIKKITGDTYAFTGSDLTVQIYPSKTINIGYLLNGAHVYRLFSLIDKNLEEISKNESNRSQTLLSKFTGKGKSLESSAYGTIELTAGGRFTWKNFDALKTIIPPGTAGSGSVQFNRALGPGLASSYEGVITFVFDDFPGYDVSFVFSTRDNGVRLTYAARENISENQVQRIGSSPLVLFFSFAP